MAVRTPDEVALYRPVDLIDGNPIPYLRIQIDGLREPQGEGAALNAGGTLLLASEGGSWNRDGRLLSLRCQLP